MMARRTNHNVQVFSDAVAEFADRIGNLWDMVPHEYKPPSRRRKVRTLGPLCLWLAATGLEDLAPDGRGNLIVSDGRGRQYVFTPTALTCQIMRLKLTGHNPVMAKFGDAMWHAFERRANDAP